MSQPIHEKTLALLNEPGRFDTIFAHLAEGGSLIDLAKLWNVRYSDVIRWIHDDPERTKRYNTALEAQSQFIIRRIIKEVSAISFFDIREIFNDDHSLKPPHEWPEDLARSIAGIEVEELFEYEDRSKVHCGNLKKVKMIDKMAGINFLGKHLKMLTDQLNVNGRVTLEDIVSGSKDGTTEDQKV